MGADGRHRIRKCPGGPKTDRTNESLQDHSCGLCGSPNCLSHILEGRGDCPFEDRSEGWNREEMAKAVETILNSDRTKPSVHEITPCSEYSRFTVEGILADPLSPDKNAVFEPIGLGSSFRASRLREKRWSDPLSYGMALVGEDIRIHIQGKGKIIIRRSPDRDGASMLYMEIADLMWPSLYCSIGGHTMAESVQGVSMVEGASAPKCLTSMLEWPYGTSRRIDMEKAILSCREANQTYGIELVKNLFSLMEEASQAARTAERTCLRSQNIWSSLEEAGYRSREEALGNRSYFIMAERAANGIVLFLRELKERPDMAKRMFSSAWSIMIGGFSGKRCPDGLDITSMGPETPLRHVWRAVSSLNPGFKDMRKVL